MKKQGGNSSTGIEKSNIVITARLAELGLLKSLVEDLANRRKDIGDSAEKVQPGFQAIETSTIEAHVSVELSLSTITERFHIDFVTSFLFTCARGKWLNYNFNWANSLS